MLKARVFETKGGFIVTQEETFGEKITPSLCYCAGDLHDVEMILKDLMKKRPSTKPTEKKKNANQNK